jgi:hypothetical protein
VEVVIGILIFGIIVVSIPIVMVKLRQRRRRRAIGRPFPESWTKIIEERIPLYQRLPSPLQKQLQNHMKVFLDEKHFEGCAGLELTDEIKVTIAAQACMLLLNHPRPSYFPRLTTVLVYPSTYIAKEKALFASQQIDPGTVVEGQSWDRGTIVLGWSHVRQGTMNVFDGHNVVLHEFAHQLDTENGAADGLPALADASQYRPYVRVVGKAYDRFIERVAKGRKDVMDAYGATNPAEFFAVLTEVFFEKSHQLKRKHPDLYEQLRRYYRVDPTDWASASLSRRASASLSRRASR